MGHVKGNLIGVLNAYSSGDITYAVANTAQVITYTNQDLVVGQMSHSTSSNPGRVTFNVISFVEVAFSAQTLKGAAGTELVYFWFKVNGVDKAFSTRTQQLDNAETDNFIMITELFAGAGDYIEIWSAAGATTISLDAAASTAFAPAQASARIRIKQWAVDSGGVAISPAI